MPVFRFHRGGLDESMKTCVFVSSIEEIREVALFKSGLFDFKLKNKKKCLLCDRGDEEVKKIIKDRNLDWVVCNCPLEYRRILDEKDLKIEKYGRIDERIGWNTYIVYFDREGEDSFVIGFLSENFNK